MRCAITHCNIVDVERATILEDMVILIDGDRIAELIPSNQWSSKEEEVQIIDALQLYILPGLIDMHVHVTFDPDIHVKQLTGHDETPVGQGILAARNLYAALQAGITTVRDLGAPLDVAFDIKRAWYNGLFPGSRPFVAGPMITAIGGHGTEDRIRIGLEVCGKESIQQAVRTVIAKGADYIKVATCGAIVSTELTLEELKAAVEEAHWCGRRVASHAHFQLRSVKNSLLAGCDTIEHCCVVDDEIIELMLTQGTFVCPTITVLARVLQFPEEFGGSGSKFVETVRQIWDVHQTNFAKMYRLGVQIIAGTDAGMQHVKFDALLDELTLMVEWGMKAEDALKTATIRASLALNQPDLGLIKPGCFADLLFIEQNPFQDIQALRNCRAIIQRGMFIHNKLEYNEKG